MNKPKTAAGYTSAQFELAKSAVLTLATYLGPFQNELVVVGGLVPSFIVESPSEPHVGTADVDIGLTFAILEHSRYALLTEHLKSAGFAADVTAKGKPAPHRWKHGSGVTTDFLIAPQPNAIGEKRMISDELSAVHARALPLAFRDRLSVTVTGKTLAGENATRDVWFAGAGAFVVLKALAFRSRGENKDAYDLLFVLRHFGARVLDEVLAAFEPIKVDELSREAVQILEDDFLTADHLGPMRAAEFEGRTTDRTRRDDDAQLVAEFVRRVRSS